MPNVNFRTSSHITFLEYIFQETQGQQVKSSLKQHLVDWPRISFEHSSSGKGFTNVSKLKGQRNIYLIFFFFKKYLPNSRVPI